MIYGQGRKRGSRNTALMMDVVHIVIGVLVVILAVITFLNPEGNQILLPAIFVLAAILNVCNGVYKYKLSGRDRVRKAAAIGQMVLAALLILIAVISGISIWR